jgi:hypothetical protein
MPNRLEYHVPMRPVIASSVAAFAVLGTSLLLPTAQAQINGSPASVTSPGFGGRPINGAPASVTSLGPRGYAPGPQHPPSAISNGSHHGTVHHHGNHNNGTAAPYLYAYPVPYAVPIPYAPDDAAADADSDVVDNDPNYQGGPTVFDRRGYGADSYVPPMKNPPPAHATDPDDPPADPGPPQPPTLLVFKDGHKSDVGNYAIVGNTLFDLTPGHTRRIPLADLDLDATRKQNDDHGVTFQLPTTGQAD